MNPIVPLILILLCILAVAAISRRIQGTIITLPIVYVLFGLLLSKMDLGVIRISNGSELIQIIAELALVLVLATDASRINLRQVRKDHDLPLRLLAIGLPLTMVLGAAAAVVIFGRLTLGEAALLGILLAPTDASLGQAVMSNRLVPQRIRQTLNIESGLNDGIAMPFLLLALAVVSAEEVGSLSYWLTSGIAQIALGILAGALVGALGTYFILWGQKSGWMSNGFQKISAISLALLAYGVAIFIGGNGFIAAFAFGAATGNLRGRHQMKKLNEYVEIEVQLLILLTFMIVFGAVMLPEALRYLDWKIILYAIVSLTLVRMLPVWISMIGANVRPVTVNFLGWFGPRGAASILYLFYVLEVENLPDLPTIYSTVLFTVFLSVILHGLSAAPAARWYGKIMANTDLVGEDAGELKTVTSFPLRHSDSVIDTELI